MSLSPRELKFISEVAHGSSPREAYKDVYSPKTENNDSIRALASKVMRRPGVREAIEQIQAEIQAEMVASCVWDARAAMISRIRDTRRLDSEIDRQLQGVEMELQGIEQDETLPDCEKKKLMGKVMQRNVIGRNLQIKQTIYADLDKSTAGQDKAETDMIAFKLLNLSVDNITENPDDYKASK